MEALPDSLLETGVYGLPEAVQLTGVSSATARRWFVGTSNSDPIFRPSIEPSQGRFAISFLDLIDLLVVGQFRSTGVSFQTIRKAYEVLQARWKTRHAFCHSDLLSDGQTILVEYVNRTGDKLLEEVIGRQQAIPELLRQYLSEIEYDPSSHIAAMWHIAEGVILDPGRNFGKPIVPSGVSTSVLYRAAIGNGRDFELVADLFKVSEQGVMNAVLFEESLAA